MISVNDFKTGLTISVDNGIWKVIDFQHVKPGKGSAFVRSKLRNLRTGAIQEKTFRAGEKVEQAMIENRRMQYLYADGDTHVFMDNETFDQTELSGDYLKDELKYLKANMEVQVQSYESEVIGVELPKACPEMVAIAREEYKLIVNVTAGSVVRLLPPLNMTQEQADDLLSRLVPAIKQFLA